MRFGGILLELPSTVAPSTLFVHSSWVHRVLLLRTACFPTATAMALLAVGLCVQLFAAAADAAKSPEEYINVLGGSDSKEDMSHGNVMPDLTMPWGFNAWAPQTNDGNSHSDGPGWWFYSQDRSFYGIRCTHQPSPWIGDYGQLRFAGAITDPDHQDEWLFSAYNPDDSAFSPYYQNFTLLAWGARTGYTTVETAPTEHGVVIHFNFPAYATGNLADGWNQTRRVWVSLNGKKGEPKPASSDSDGVALLTGYTTDVGNGRGNNFKHHYHATVSGGADGKTAVTPFATGGDKGKWMWMDFNATDKDTEKLVVRVATSLISSDQAALNHKREVAGKDLTDVASAAKAVWSKLMSKISIDDMGTGYSAQEEEDWRTGFYSSLYRAAKL
jgi:putative alpha-1,2-mannosidase